MAQNWPAPEIVVEGPDATLKNLEGSRLRYVLEEIGKRSVDVLIAVKLDRFTRSLSDLCQLIKALEDGKCALISLQEGLDSTHTSGQQMLNLLKTVSLWEREFIAERTREALRDLRRKGQVFNHPPLGFESAEGRLKRLDSEFALGRTIVQLHMKGVSLNQIAHLLNKQGIKGKNGGRWHATTVKKVIQRAELYSD